VFRRGLLVSVPVAVIVVAFVGPVAASGSQTARNWPCDLHRVRACIGGPFTSWACGVVGVKYGRNAAFGCTDDSGLGGCKLSNPKTAVCPKVALPGPPFTLGRIVLSSYTGNTCKYSVSSKLGRWHGHLTKHTLRRLGIPGPY
jgi:hypothetical protein